MPERDYNRTTLQFGHRGVPWRHHDPHLRVYTPGPPRGQCHWLQKWCHSHTHSETAVCSRQGMCCSTISFWRPHVSCSTPSPPLCWQAVRGKSKRAKGAKPNTRLLFNKSRLEAFTDGVHGIVGTRLECAAGHLVCASCLTHSACDRQPLW